LDETAGAMVAVLEPAIWNTGWLSRRSRRDISLCAILFSDLLMKFQHLLNLRHHGMRHEAGRAWGCFICGTRWKIDQHERHKLGCPIYMWTMEAIRRGQLIMPYPDAVNAKRRKKRKQNGTSR
jgi:hypothetical protein